VKNPTRQTAGLLCGALLALYALLALPALLLDSSVADEHPHILSGWLYWESGRFSGGLDNPPLGQLLVAAPLRLLGVDYQFPSDAKLWAARVPVLLLALALAALVGHWARRMGGMGTACVALLALCLEPNLLAHGHLATLDLPVTFLWWCGLWLWRGVLEAEWAAASPPATPNAGAAVPENAGARRTPWGKVAGFAMVAALAVFTKFTGFLLLPACWLASLVLLRRRRAWLRVTAYVALALLGVGVLSYAVYAFGPTRHGVPEQLLNALTGKLAHQEEGHFAYLVGRRSLHGFLEYYLAALLFKTPLPLLLFAALGLVFGWRRLSPPDRTLLTVPAALLLVVFSLTRVDIGVRHILPLVPALVLLAAVAVVHLWQKGRVARVAVSILILAWALGFARAAPQYLTYFNVLAGGPAGGHRFLLDSNLAWGQDDGRLTRFLAQAEARGETWEVNPPGATARAGRLAVDANTLHQLLRADPAVYDWLLPLRPVGYAGYSWRLYDLQLETYEQRAAQRPDDVRAQIALAEALSAAGQLDAASEVYERAARTLPTASVFHSAAFVALERADYAGAEAWIRRGLERQPTDRSLAGLLQRLRLERRFSGTRPGASGRDALELGLWWAERGDIDKALPWLRRAATDRPRDVESQRALAIALAQLGRFDEAARALEQSPPSLGAEAAPLRRLARADAAFAQRSAAEASAPGAAADTASSFAAPLWMELATALFHVRHYDRAAAVLMDILRADPAEGAALALLCEMHVRAKLRLVPEPLTPRPAPGVPVVTAPGTPEAATKGLHPDG